MDGSPTTHEQLLTLARMVQAAAHDDDAERLESLRTRLIEALTTHLDAEQEALSSLSEPQRGALVEGQQRLVDLVRSLAFASHGQPAPSRIADELVAYLSLQAEDERRHLK